MVGIFGLNIDLIGIGMLMATKMIKILSLLIAAIVIVDYDKPESDCIYEFERFSGNFCQRIEKLCLNKNGSILVKQSAERFTSRSIEIGKWDWLNDSLISIKKEKRTEIYRRKQLKNFSLLVPSTQNWQSIFFSADSIVNNNPEILELRELLKSNNDEDHDTLVKLKSEIIGRFFCRKKIEIYVGGRISL
jgi:hypothetical protein